MSSLSKLALDCHELLLLSGSFVIRLAVSSGMDVKRETTSKNSLRSLILVRNSLVFLIVWGDVLTKQLNKQSFQQQQLENNNRGQQKVCQLPRYYSWPQIVNLQTIYETQKHTVILYVNYDSNHPPSLLRGLPDAINKRLSNTSSDRRPFDSASPPY